MGMLACSRNRQLFGGEKNCDGTDRLRQEHRVERRPAILRAVAAPRARRPAARRRTACRSGRNCRRTGVRSVFVRAERCRVRRQRERRLVDGIDRAVGDEQHAERLLRPIQRQRRHLELPLERRQLLLRAQRVQPAAGPLLLELGGQIEMRPAPCRARGCCPRRRAQPRDDARDTRPRSRARSDAASRPRSARRPARCPRPARAAPRRPPRRSACRPSATRSPDFAASPSCPETPRPVFSVVVVTLPVTCSSVAARAWRSSPSARRMPAAATAAEGLFAIARSIAC